MRKLLLWLVWLGFILYVIFLAPPIQPNTFRTIQNLFAGSIPIINPIILSLFSMIGIWILIYASLIFADGRMQRLPAWVFIVASAASGVAVLIPYLALREPNGEFSGQKDVGLQWFDSHLNGVILTISTIVLFAFALLFGDWSAFRHEFQTNRFIHAMSLAFCLFGLLFPYPTLLSDDMVRRGLRNDSQLFWITALVPLFGPLLYLCLRPPLLSVTQSRNT